MSAHGEKSMLKGGVEAEWRELFEMMLTEDQLSSSTEQTKTPLDTQEGGDHYKNWKIQPVEFAMTNNLDLCQANVVKYVCRFRAKGGVEDLKKAKHYIELLAHFEYDENI